MAIVYLFSMPISALNERLDDLLKRFEALEDRFAKLQESHAKAIFWERLFKLMVGVIFTAGITHETRISRIEENRATTSDFIQLERRLVERLPVGIDKDLDHLKATLGDMDTRQRDIQIRLGKLEIK